MTDDSMHWFGVEGSVCFEESPINLYYIFRADCQLRGTAVFVRNSGELTNERQSMDRIQNCL